MKKFSMLLLMLMVRAVLVTGCSSQKEDGGDAGSESQAIAPGNVEAVAENEFVSIGQYKGISYNAVKTEVTAEMVEQEVQYLLGLYAEAGEADHNVVQEGDNIVFDFSGSHNGEKFDGGTATDYTMENVGNGGFIPGFEENLIGHQVGDQYAFDVVFPDPYQNNPDLSGENVTFEITIKKILGEEKLPELTDDFVANVQTYFEAKSVDELYDVIKQQMIDYYADSDKTTNMSAAWDAVTETFVAKKENTEEIERYINEFVDYYHSYAEMYEYDDFDKFLSETFGMTNEDFMKEAESYAKVLSTEDAGVALIAEKEGLAITAEELAAGYEKFSNEYGMDNEAVLNYFGTEENFSRELLYDKVSSWVYENANPNYTEQDESLDMPVLE